VTRWAAEAWIAAAVEALKTAGRLDHVEIGEAAGLKHGSGRVNKCLIRELKRRNLIVWAGYKTHRYACGRVVSREAYKMGRLTV
jgi:hypothetical protein